MEYNHPSELIKELNEWKNNNPDMSDADFANWQKQMNLIRSQFTHN